MAGLVKTLYTRLSRAAFKKKAQGGGGGGGDEPIGTLYDSRGYLLLDKRGNYIIPKD